MPDTPATRLIVTKAYDRLIREKINFSDKVPGTTQADVDAARKVLRAAIEEWEKPGQGEDPKMANKNRKAQKSFMDKIRTALKGK